MEEIDVLKYFERFQEKVRDKLVAINLCLKIDPKKAKEIIIKERIKIIDKLNKSHRTMLTNAIYSIENFYTDLLFDFKKGNYELVEKKLNKEIELINEDLRNSDNFIG